MKRIVLVVVLVGLFAVALVSMTLSGGVVYGGDFPTFSLTDDPVWTVTADWPTVISWPVPTETPVFTDPPWEVTAEWPPFPEVPWGFTVNPPSLLSPFVYGA